MNLNPGKCRLLVSKRIFWTIWAQIGELKFWESLKQKLLVDVIDRDLRFNEYVSSLC